MADIRVDTVRLKGVSERIQQAVGAALESVSSVESTGAGMERMWEGEAEEKLQQMLTEDLQALREALASLKEIAVFENSAASSYDACEAETVSRMSGTAV